MRHATSPVRLLSALTVMLGLTSVPAFAMDVTGDWRFGFSSGFGIFEQDYTLAQAGSTLTAGFYAGTIDATTGVFSLQALRHCATLENPGGADFPIAIEGTFGADGNTMSGTFNDVAQVGRSCVAVSGTAGGFRHSATTTSTSVTTSTSLVPTTTSTSVTTTTSPFPTTTSTTLPSTRLDLKMLRLTAPADARRKRLVLDARDPDVTIGLGDGSAHDPTLHGGALRVRMPGFDDVYALPAANWTSVGGGYRYRDSRQLTGPITNVDVRPGKQIKVVGKGAELGHELEADPGSVKVSLTVGARVSCVSTFDGTNRFKPGKLTSKNAGPPGSCQ